MANFFLENPDLLLHFKNLDLRDIVAIAEDDYAQAKEYSDAPVNYDDAMTNEQALQQATGNAGYPSSVMK